MHDWNPDLYRRFESERTRPALELLARIPFAEPARIADLGCGPGNSTQALLERFPSARIVGVDSSAAMLRSARLRLPQCSFVQDDISQWQPTESPMIIYANASLQWVGDHETLFPRLMSLVTSGGYLAVQMPDNRDQPTHRIMRLVAQRPEWQALIGDAAQGRVKILSVSEYYDLLSSAARSVDIWRTTYYHVMPSASAIVDWVRSTGLRPFIEKLNDHQQSEFIESYRQAIAEAYSPQTDGTVLLAFPRLFMLAQR